MKEKRKTVKIGNDLDEKKKTKKWDSKEQVESDVDLKKECWRW